jgi:hypothetical protein
MTSFVPRLETLPEAQRHLWPQLSAVSTDFVLYGGTALSLQVGGRISVDFDFFTTCPFEADKLAGCLPFLKGAVIRQRAVDTATFVLGKGNDSVAISFFGGRSFGRVADPVRFSDNGVYAAGLLDLAAQKVKVVQLRAAAKDYQDIHKLMSEGITLEMAFGAAKALYPEFNPAMSLKALSYYDDVAHLAGYIQRDLESAASRVREMAQISKRSDSLLPDLGAIARER